MFSADSLASTSRMLFVAVVPFAPVPGTLLGATSLAHGPIIDHRRVSAYEAVRAVDEEEFELLSMPRASQESSYPMSRMARSSTLRQRKGRVEIFDETPFMSGSYSTTGGRPSGLASTVSLAKQSVISRSKNVLGALRRRPYLRI